MDGLLIISSGALAISDGSNVIISSCLVILTPSRVNVDSWHGGMTASVTVHQCRSVAIQVHDSWDSLSDKASPYLLLLLLFFSLN